MIKVAIVDDNALNRNTIREKITNSNIVIDFEARNGDDFFGHLERIPSSDYPQVVLMDLEMPVLDGIAAISSAVIRYPGIKFIVLTIFEDNERIFEAIKAGASGYLLKEDKGVNIIEAIRNVVEYDGIPMSPAIARRAMKLLSEGNQPDQSLQSPKDYQLSDRETEILTEIVKGLSPVQIAEKLFISPNTVRTHVNNIYKKLHLNSRSQIINLAYKNKWI
ncbi:response regulator transcription factor [Kaistella sp. PBT33-4]|uniref:response regulator transcription factor n=1 Tax=Kaistella sp. PBT33-4 TaxID=3032000 RepID=UPI0023D8B8D0|nr:response regulator transcription factor [Kaistella sp. PBT33-4]MDF0720307.1 response regulator transcription factor [Kaistella sp. PBT33-4]